MDVFGTSFLPNTLYFHRFLNAKQPIIDLGEHFIKQTQRNRTFILASNGPMPIIIPLCKNNSKRVYDMEISYSEHWQPKALRAIKSSYKNSPYYEHYQPEFEELLMRKEQRLHEYNRGLFEWLLKELDINIQVSYSCTYIENESSLGKRRLNDYRNFDFYAINCYPNATSYKQVFSYKIRFLAGLSLIDLLFNKGPEALPFLK